MKWLTKNDNTENNLSLNSVKRDMDTFFDDFFDLEPVSLFKTDWAPSVDISENKKTIEVNAEMPGLDEKDIEVKLENNILSIAGKKEEEHQEEDREKKYLLKERNFGSFERSIKLPDNIDPDKVKAEFKKGVLSISIPKSKEDEAKKIKINVH